jgi:hypothetical protein
MLSAAARIRLRAASYKYIDRDKMVTLPLNFQPDLIDRKMC